MFRPIARFGAAVLSLLSGSAVWAGDAPATIRVLAPADAVLTIDGAPTQATSAVRNFVTPPLPAGRDFRYDLLAQLVQNGKSVTIERRVMVRAGQETVADLGLPDAPPRGGETPRYAPPGRVWPAMKAAPAGVGGAGDNWKPDSSDPFYPWD